MSHPEIPTFSLKKRDIDGNIQFVNMPRKGECLREVLLNLEHAPMEDEIVDLKFVLYCDKMCDYLDKQSNTAKPASLCNTGKFK